MSATTAPETFSDLYTDLLNRAREDTSLTATINQAKRYINIALLDMHVGFAEKVPWAEREAVLITHPSYTTGENVMSEGSGTLFNLTGTFSTSDGYHNNVRVGGRMQMAGTKDIYTLTSVNSNTAAVVTPSWIGSGTTSNEYVYFEDEYDLASDFLRPVDIQFFDAGRTIALIGRRDFKMYYPRNDILGRPRAGTMIDGSSWDSSSVSPTRRIRFNPAPNARWMIPYSYITANLVTNSGATAAQTEFSADGDIPIVPKRVRMAIVLKALHLWYRDKKDDVRSAEAGGEYVDFMTRVVSDVETGAQNPKLHPRLGPYSRSARRPWSRGGRYDVSGRFDYLEDR